MKKLIPTTIIILVITACSICKNNHNQTSNYKIVLGSGGGFTGKYSEYILEASGDVYFNNLDKKELTYIGKLPKDSAPALFRDFEKLNIEKQQSQKPGNMNYYLEKRGNKKSYKLNWVNTNDDKEPKEAAKFYRRVLGMIIK